MTHRLLIIDDEVDIGRYVASVARTCGYDARTVSEAEDFRQQVAAWEPSHIVLDLQMPECDGIELLRFLAEGRSTARIVVMSGVDQKIIESARHLGVGSGLDIAAMVQKPVRAAELRGILEEIKETAGTIDEAAIRAAIANRDFHLVYQPKVDLRRAPLPNGRLPVVGFEALLRWHHPRRGVLPPGEFLRLAETLSLMDDLTDLVVDEAVGQLRAWREKGFTTSLAINVSAANLHTAGFAERLVRQCREAAIDPASLIIELTETAAMTDPIKAMDILTRLRLKGFRLSIDDFGTGYSSLVQLQRLPFSELKIDRALVADCASSKQSRMIVKTAIDLAQNLGLLACAEGIETAATLAVIQDLGCEFAQGYHIGRPMAVVQAEAWLSEASPSGT
ncbi:EAL domain-containing response regulator [Azospirillum sp.]|uniref:EAL domain-containing response regulator n=1 Tax=Azospirillum sp. TaxID=34012 RepID=UPI003D7161F5